MAREEIPQLDEIGAGKRAHKRALQRLPKRMAVGALLPPARNALTLAAEDRDASTNQRDRYLAPADAAAWGGALLSEVAVFAAGGPPPRARPLDEILAATGGRNPRARAAIEASLLLSDACLARDRFHKLVIDAAIALVRAGVAVEAVDGSLRAAYAAHAEG